MVGNAMYCIGFQCRVGDDSSFRQEMILFITYRVRIIIFMLLFFLEQRL